MKKLLYAVVMLGAVALAFSSCKKDSDGDKVVAKRLVMCGDQWDKYAFTYGEDGRIAKVDRNEGERTWTFTWNGNKATVAYVKDGANQTPLQITLGDNGFISTYTDEWGDVRNLTYKNGYLVKIDKAGDVKSNLVMEGGNLAKWSRFNDGVEQFKFQTFLSDKNIGGIHPDYADKTDPARWFYEIGLCGKPSKNLLDQAAWDGSDAIAVHTYVKDADGYVTKVSKVYGTDEPEIYEYAWELVK